MRRSTCYRKKKQKNLLSLEFGLLGAKFQWKAPLFLEIPKFPSSSTQCIDKQESQLLQRDYAMRSVIWNVVKCHITVRRRVSAATGRPAQRSGSAHAKYYVSHHTVIKEFLLLGLGAESTVGVINSRLLLSDDHQKIMTSTGELKLSWQRPKRSAVPEIWLVPV